MTDKPTLTPLPKIRRACDEARFWNATERAEGDFTGTQDVVAFRRRMKRLGHPAEVIADRIEAIHPHLAHAVNSHHDLIEALRGLVQAIERRYPYGDPRQSQSFGDALKSADAILTKEAGQ